MPATLHLAEHFAPEELYRRYRSSNDVAERTHWQVIWLKSQDRSTTEISDVVGYSKRWIHTLVHRYNEGAAEALRDQRHEHPAYSFVP